MLEKKLHEELLRFKAINKYAKTMIMEQETPPTEDEPTGDLPMDLPPADGVDTPPTDLPMDLPPADVPADVPTDETSTDLPPDDGGLEPEMDSTEEIDITDLVNMTKSIKKDFDENKNSYDGVNNKMDDVFTKLGDLESKLTQMDMVFDKIEQLGNKIENIKEPTPQEKLEMRSLDSYPFSQNPQQFFSAKQEQMKASGKNEYVLTKQDIENYPTNQIKSSFNPETQEDEYQF